MPNEWPRLATRGSTPVNAVVAGTKQYHFIEIMTCPGGCVGGGGQPRFTDDAVRLARIQAIYREDEGKALRKSHENPDVARLYAEFLGAPTFHDEVAFRTSRAGVASRRSCAPSCAGRTCSIRRRCRTPTGSSWPG